MGNAKFVMTIVKFVSQKQNALNLQMAIILMINKIQKNVIPLVGVVHHRAV